jgi:hypothetical protein
VAYGAPRHAVQNSASRLWLARRMAQMLAGPLPGRATPPATTPPASLMIAGRRGGAVAVKVGACAIATRRSLTSPLDGAVTTGQWSAARQKGTFGHQGGLTVVLPAGGLI